MRPFASSHRAGGQGLHQETGADDSFCIRPGRLQLVRVQVKLFSQPLGRRDGLGHLAAPRQFGLVFRMAAKRPDGQQRSLCIVVARHAEIAALGHGDQLFEHVGPAFGTRQQRVVAQRHSGLVQIAARGLQQVKADHVDHAVPRFFEFRAQKLASKVPGDLHDALGRIGIDGGKPLCVDDAATHAVGQHLVEERACVVQLQCVARWHSAGIGGFRHGLVRRPVQMADSSSDTRAAGVALPRSVSLVSNLPSSSSAGSSASSNPRSKARALARSTSKVSMNRSRHS